MDIITRVIQKKLNMTLDQFCAKHLNCERQAFSVRLRKGKLYPNEYLYLSIVTDTPVKELFGKTFEDTFIYRGDEEVSARLKQLIANLNDPQRLSELLSAEVSIPVVGKIEPEASLEVLAEVEPEIKPEPITKAPDPKPAPKPEPDVFVFEDTFN